jgi:sodium transport system permease protein
VAGLALGRIVPGMLLFFMLIAGATVATDLLAGEKERGTLETLLTTGAERLEIVLAKHLVILAVTVGITLIQTTNLLIYVGFNIVPMPEGWAAVATPDVVLLLLALFLPLAALVASILLLTSGYAKTYKESQLYFTPVFLLMLLPGLTPMLPELPLRSAIVLVPAANLALSAREVLAGVYDWPLLAVAWFVTAATAAGLLLLAVKLLEAERLVTAAEVTEAEFTGGPALFQKRVVQWFVMLWACLLLVGNYTATWDLRAQVFLNIVVLFLGMSALVVHRYRLDPGEVFAWRAPKRGVWPAVIIAAPCGMLAGTGVFRLADLVFPVPKEILEGFSQSFLPGSMPTWQMFLFLAILPGVIEELAFRGLLLNGLSTRLRPVALALTVGLAFGLFHGALFRVAPTGFLGVMLAAITLLTGSIFPAMLWHSLNNSLSLLTGMWGLPLSELGPGWYWFGAAGLAAAFWIVWRNRSPYPGLRTKHQQPGIRNARPPDHVK